jgi:hypothetical protein
VTKEPPGRRAGTAFHHSVFGQSLPLGNSPERVSFTSGSNNQDSLSFYYSTFQLLVGQPGRWRFGLDEELCLLTDLNIIQINPGHSYFPRSTGYSSSIHEPVAVAVNGAAVDGQVGYECDNDPAQARPERSSRGS